MYPKIYREDPMSTEQQSVVVKGKSDH